MADQQVTWKQILAVGAVCSVLATVFTAALYFQAGNPNVRSIFALSIMLILSLLAPCIMVLRKLDAVKFCKNLASSSPEPVEGENIELGEINPGFVGDVGSTPPLPFPGRYSVNKRLLVARTPTLESTWASTAEGNLAKRGSHLRSDGTSMPSPFTGRRRLSIIAEESGNETSGAERTSSGSESTGSFKMPLPTSQISENCEENESSLSTEHKVQSEEEGREVELDPSKIFHEDLDHFDNFWESLE